MAKNITVKYQSPVGELEWVITDGEGKEDLKGDMKYQASLVLEGEKAEGIKKEVQEFWETNKPKGIKEPKSLGYYNHKVSTGEKDEDDSFIYEETGKTVMVFKTGTTYADGNPKVIPVFNAKGVEVDLKGKKIGNGSRGRVKGAMAIYTVEAKGKVIDAGVTFYLDAVQLAKFVEYQGGPNFDEMPEDEEGDFEGIDSDGMDALDEKQDSAEEKSNDKPKL